MAKKTVRIFFKSIVSFVGFHISGLFQNRGVASTSYVLRVRVTSAENFAETPHCENHKPFPTHRTGNSRWVHPCTEPQPASPRVHSSGAQPRKAAPRGESLGGESRWHEESRVVMVGDQVGLIGVLDSICHV